MIDAVVTESARLRGFDKLCYFAKIPLAASA